MNDYKRRYRKYLKGLLQRYKKIKGCELCGYREHACALELDHIDPSKKTATPSQLHKVSKAKMKRELKLCRVLCSNCHRIETNRRRHATTMEQ